jgi:hypothetical protein
VDTWTSFIGARTVITVAAVLGVSAGGIARAAPNACGFLSVADVAAVTGGTVTGGKISQLDPTVGTASCMYTSGALQIGVIVHQYSSGAEAQKEVASQLKDSRAHDDAGQKTTVEAGVGDAAFSSTMSGGFEMSAAMSAHGPITVQITIVGKGSASIPHERLRALIAKAASE